MAQEEEEKTSKYNSGLNIILRLDTLWRDTHAHSRAGMFQRWNADLDRVWVELARDLKDDKYKIKKTDFDRFDTKLSQQGGFQDHSDGFEPTPKEQKDQRSQQYKILMEKELFLRRLENELGKGTAYSDDDEDDMD